MDGKLNINPKISGAVLIGFSLVAGTYIITNFNQPKQTVQQVVTQDAAPTTRTSIAVSDDDNNGIEDWKDEFLTPSSIVVEQSESEEYVPPETLTGKVGINLAEEFIRSKTDDVFGLSSEELVTQTGEALLKTIELEPYSSSDIIILEEWEDDDIVNYANTVATVVYTYNDPDAEYELDILSEIMQNGKTEQLPELANLAGIYTNYYTDTLKIPVPSILAKEHLDLINTYKAIAEDLEGMMLAVEDPMVSFLHIQRYEDDSLAFAYALQNMYTALEPHASLFTTEDPALMFVVFSPDGKYLELGY